MADGGGGERQFLGNFVKNKTKYGATTKPMPKFKNYVKHTITRSDTLMGIALKYGATVSLIFDSCDGHFGPWQFRPKQRVH